MHLLLWFWYCTQILRGLILHSCIFRTILLSVSPNYWSRLKLLLCLKHLKNICSVCSVSCMHITVQKPLNSGRSVISKGGSRVLYRLDVSLTVHHELLTNLMHWLLFIHKILSSSTCFEPQVLIFRRIQLYTCSTWYPHSLSLKLCTERPPENLMESDSTICCMYTTVSSWR